MTQSRAVLLQIAIFFVMAVQGSAQTKSGQQLIANLDVGKVNKFCDVGFRFTANSIDFNLGKFMEKIIQLGLKVDPKVLTAVESQAALQIALVTYYCRMLAANQISPTQFSEFVKPVLQYSVDLQELRKQVEKQADGTISPSPDGHVDPKQIAANELGVKIESAVQIGTGDLTVILQRFTKRYLCQCKAGE